MATTIALRNKELAKVKDVKGFFAGLDQEYGGKWVAITDNDEIVADKSLEAVYSEAEKKGSNVKALFYAAEQGELLLR